MVSNPLTKLSEIEDLDFLAAARRVIEDEGRAADDRRWDDWLDLYVEECEYWVPTWRADGQLADNPDTQLSHIYYDDRSALEDRVSRIKSPFSPASYPAPRTLHMFSSFCLRDGSSPERVMTRCNWSTHIFEPFTRLTSYIFGFAEHDLVTVDGELRIARKKVVLLNDFVPTMLDIHMF